MIVKSFVKKLVDEKNDKIKFDIIPKTKKKCKPVTYGCITFIDSYRLSSNLDSLVKTLSDKRNKTLKDLEEQIVDNETKILNKEHSYNNDSIKIKKQIIQMKLKN